MTTSKLKIYPSASGFVRGQGVITEYNSGCLRYIVASQDTIRKTIDPKFMKVGEVHENRHAEALGASMKLREEPIKVEINNKVVLSGRADFITSDDSIHETKATLSKNFRRDVIRKGKYKLSHLAQTVCYMLHFKLNRAKIVTGYYEEDTSPSGQAFYAFREGRDFAITLDEHGEVYVDGEDSGYSVSDQYKHTLAVAEVLVSGEIKDRPINHVDFTGPCFFCPLKLLCKSYDKGEVDQKGFKAKAKQIINSQGDEK